jgi:hypothetical protein
VEGVGALSMPCSQPHLTPRRAGPSSFKPINCRLKVIVPEIAKWTSLWSLNFSFKIFYTFSLSINFSLQILTLVVPYYTDIGPRMPSECPSLTLQTIYSFVKKVAFIKEASFC